MSSIPLMKYSGTATKSEIKRFQELVGSILYTAIMIRPDVAFAAAQLSLFLTNPGPEHHKAGLQGIRYLWSTRYLGIRYGGETESQVMIAGDASFADGPDTRRSSQGYVIILFGGPVVWKASRQATIATSTTEAELNALSETAKESMAYQRLCCDLKLDLGKVWNVYCDNLQTIRLIINENMGVSTKLRHVDIHNMWVKQEHMKGSFKITYLDTILMPADGFTKALPRQCAQNII